MMTRDELLRRIAAGQEVKSQDLRLADLSAGRFAGLDLSRADLSGLSLRGAALTDCDLTAANLAHADLRDSEWRGCALGKANLAGALAQNIRLLGGNLTHARFDGADLRGARFEGCQARGLTLEGALTTGLTQTKCEMFPKGGTGVVRIGWRPGVKAALAALLCFAATTLALAVFCAATPPPPPPPTPSPEATAQLLWTDVLRGPHDGQELTAAFARARRDLAAALEASPGLSFLGLRGADGRLRDRLGTPLDLDSDGAARCEELAAQAVSSGRPLADPRLGVYFVAAGMGQGALELGFAKPPRPARFDQAALAVAATSGALGAVVLAVLLHLAWSRGVAAQRAFAAAAVEAVVGPAARAPTAGSAETEESLALGIAAAAARARERILVERATAAATPVSGGDDEARAADAARLQEQLDKRSAVLAATNAKLAERSRELKEKNERLERIARKKDEFFSIMTHDLRSPLTVMRGVSSMFKEGVLGELSAEQRDMVDTLDSSIHSQLDLINDLLDSAKLEEGRMQLGKSVFRLGELTAEVASALSLLAREKGIALETEEEPGLPAVHADRDKLRRVLANLLSNAIKFTEPGGGVVVAVRRGKTDGWQACSVLDTGVGIPEEDLPKLFDKFQQARNRATGREKGTGLGLYICKQIIEAHGGEVKVDSKVGEGSVFTFTLPGAAAQ